MILAENNKATMVIINGNNLHTKYSQTVDIEQRDNNNHIKQT